MHKNSGFNLAGRIFRTDISSSDEAEFIIIEEDRMDGARITGRLRLDALANTDRCDGKPEYEDVLHFVS